MSWRNAATRIAAAAGALAAAAIFAVVGAPSAVAVTPTHVGLVVVGQGSYCVPWTSGMTGARVLSAAGLQVVTSPQQGNIIITIGNHTEPDSTKLYWAYYENTGSGWSYSHFGAGGTHPQPGTVDGWIVNQNGGTDQPPPATSYAAICGSKDAPAPPPAPVTTAAPAKTTKPDAAPTRAAAAPPPAAATSAVVVSPLAPSAAQSTGPGLVFTEPTAPTGSTASSAAPARSPSPSPASADKKASSGSPVALIVAGGAIAALAAAGAGTAWFRNTRRE